jgi:hypothetical protein
MQGCHAEERVFHGAPLEKGFEWEGHACCERAGRGGCAAAHERLACARERAGLRRLIRLAALLARRARLADERLREQELARAARERAVARA